MTVRRKYLDGRYGQLHLRIAEPVASSGRRPVVCFHLSPVSGAIYENLLVQLGQDRLALAPDTPGYGASDGPTEPPSIEDYATAMAEMLEILAIPEADCIGFHTGSKIAIELALQQPRRVRHLVLISTPIYTPDELRAMRVEFAPMTIRDDGSHLTDYWQELMRWRGPGQTPQDLMRYFGTHVSGGERRHFGHRAAFQYSNADALPRLEQPVLVLNNNDDLQEYTRRALPLLKNGAILERADWGHGFLDLHAAEFAGIARTFFDRAT
ncbi:MAG: alpha/beta hydrolase [Pseudomonadales bacterium]|nr:alpha/beta hydrolase [Pseudomonadales bacterium]